MAGSLKVRALMNLPFGPGYYSYSPQSEYSLSRSPSGFPKIGSVVDR